MAIYGLLVWLALVSQRLAQQQWLHRNSLYRSGWLIFGVSTAILLLTPLIHEIGHAVAGRLVGLRFQLMAVGPVQITRGNGRYRLSWQKRFNLLSGQVASLPTDFSHLRRRMFVFAIGGPLANLLLGLIALFVYQQYRGDYYFMRNQSWVVETAVATAVISLVFFFAAIKPNAYQSGIPADGRRLLMLLEGGVDANRWYALVSLNGLNMQGIRPRDWPGDLIERAVQVNGRSYDDLTARLLAYYWAVDNGRLAQAGQWLSEAMKIPLSTIININGNLILEKAYFVARFQNDIAHGRRWLSKIRGGKPNALYLRAEAAIALAEGDIQLAHEKAQSALTLLNDQPQTGQTLAEIDWLQAMLS